MTATYNGVDIQELSFEYAADEWGAKQEDDTSKVTWKAPLKRGSLKLEAEDTFEEVFYELTVSLSQKEFENMQK